MYMYIAVSLFFFIKQIYMHTAKVKQKIARIEANTNLLPTIGQTTMMPTTEHVKL